ncbi:hypothetical protein [Actinoplanes italicus]|uniref:Uncharacterized protein n=1 Tax=Actinoplanes italicus TaxID=113567 RepID=A0A2T0JP09_9ACTN|nr:hypothetical protein [Actinoplanes italicus]PRX09159.1 hypothetical protein CLV67_13724 [Actinoplanes italicus]
MNGAMVPFCDGAQTSDERMLEKAPESMPVGATGLIFGRNVRGESLRFVFYLRQVFEKCPTP